MSQSTRLLGLFAKWPAAGATKTRIAPGDPILGERIARAFLRDSLERFARLSVHRILVFSPTEARDEFAAFAGQRFELQPQAAGDLGARLDDFITRALAGGARTVIAVGADSPTLPPTYIEQGFNELETADVVLGPATDGGFYLIGSGRQKPPLGPGIDWSSSRVLAQTVARLANSALRLALLPPWYDVDTADDLSMLAGHIAALRRAGQDPDVLHTEALLQQIDPDRRTQI